MIHEIVIINETYYSVLKNFKMQGLKKARSTKKKMYL